MTNIPWFALPTVTRGAEPVIPIVVKTVCDRDGHTWTPAVVFHVVPKQNAGYCGPGKRCTVCEQLWTPLQEVMDFEIRGTKA